MDVKASYDERVTVCLESDLLIRLLPVHCYVVNRKAQTTFIGGTNRHLISSLSRNSTANYLGCRALC